MSKVGAYEAKTKFSELLKRAADGERIVVTKHGVPVAELVPVAKAKELTPQEAIAALKSFRKGRCLNGTSIRELIEEGRM